MSDPTPPPETPPPRTEAPPPAKTAPSDSWRKIASQIVAVLIIVGAAVLALQVWGINEKHPRTDDAVARANVVGIAPRVHGQIIKLNVEDNQQVNAGDVLFEIDPEDFQLILDKATADLATLDQQIEVARAQDANLKFQIKAAEAGVDSAMAQLNQASNTLQRMLPLLPEGFAKADDVDKAQTAEKVGLAALAAAQQLWNTAKTTVSPLASLMAQRAAALAGVNLAALELSYCKVVAPFSGRVLNLNISAGAYVSAGIPVFSMLDTHKWYVMAQFREGELEHVKTGSPVDLYLMSAPNRHFQGTVQGIGWAVEPTDEIDLPHSLPIVRRELDWVHVAQRFPVRIEVENPDPELFRMGESAVAIIK